MASSLLDRLLRTPEYSDLMIHCRGTILEVHCNIVCTQCPIIATAVAEARATWKPLELDFSIEDPAILRAMIEFLYLSNYQPKNSASSNNRSSYQQQVTHPSLCYTVERDGKDDTAMRASPLRMHPIRPLSMGNLPTLLASSEPSCLAFDMEMFTAGHRYRIDALSDKAVQKLRDALEPVNMKHDTGFMDFCRATKILWAYPADNRDLDPGWDVQVNTLKTKLARFYVLRYERALDHHTHRKMLPKQSSFWNFVEDARKRLEKEKKNPEKGKKRQSRRSAITRDETRSAATFAESGVPAAESRRSAYLSMARHAWRKLPRWSSRHSHLGQVGATQGRRIRRFSEPAK